MNIKIVFFIFILILISVLTTLIYQNTQQADINYYQGHRFFEKGEYEKAIESYQRVALLNPAHQKALKELAYSYQWTQRHPQAIEAFNKLLTLNPQDHQIKRALAQTLSWNREFEEAVSLYEEVLQVEEEPEVKQELADVLSWDKKYDRALDLYEEVVSESEDIRARLQKARVLSWARQYDKSAKEYRKILDAGYNEQVALELKAKQACWNNRVKEAIRYCREAIEKDPENVEVMFDLGQVCSYQSMWKEAIAEYKRILGIYPVHFRGKEALKKTELTSTRISLKSGYEFFEADGPERGADIRRRTFFNRMTLPVNYNLQIEAGYNLTGRSFSDFGDVLENESRIGITYLQCPDWWLNGFYDFIEYNKNIDNLHTFGGGFNFRLFDIGVSRLSFKRRRLENSSRVIRGGYYHDNYQGRTDLDINKRLKIGADYLYANYSDDNNKHEPGADILYYLSLEPRRLAMKYRYFFRDFDATVQEYFSPRDFSTHKITVNWRHFLNKEEVFFGADDLYYDIKYDASVDSEGIASHNFSAELYRDINKKLNFSIKGSVTNSSADVYKDKNIIASVKYYF